MATAARLGKSIATVAKDCNVESVGVVLQPGASNAGITQVLLGERGERLFTILLTTLGHRGIHDASYVDNRYRKVPPGGFKPSQFKSLTFLGCSETVGGSLDLTNRLTGMIASGVQFAKDLVGKLS